MRICLISSSFPRFSNNSSRSVIYQGSFVYELAQYLTQRGHYVHVVTPLYPDSPESEVRDGIVLSRFRFYGWQYGWVLARLEGIPLIPMITYVLSAVWTARKAIKKDELDIIHAYWVIPAGFIGILVRWLTRVPVIATAPGSDINIWSHQMLPRQLIRFTCHQLDGLFAHGSTIAKRAIYLGIDESKVVINLGDGGIDLDLLKPLGKREETRRALGISVDIPVALFVGTLQPPKRVDHLILAMKQVIQEIPTIRLCIVGEGMQEALIRQLCYELGLEQSVLLLGPRPHSEIPALLEAADLFVYPSDSEGLPTAIREALTMGVPVVASRVGGIPDLIEHGKTGFLVEPGDVEGLSHFIISILRDLELAQCLSKNGQAFARSKLDKEVIMPRIEDGYQRILNGPRCRP